MPLQLLSPAVRYALLLLGGLLAALAHTATPAAAQADGPYRLSPTFGADLGVASSAVELGHFVTEPSGAPTLDAAVLAEAANSLRFWQRSALGAWSRDSARDRTTGAGPIALAIGDLDGDGASDFVTANRGDNSVSLLLAATTSQFAVGANPAAVTLGDFDGDGDLDVAVACTFPDCVRVGWNDGSGQLSFAASIVVAARPIALAAADLNGDGVTDLAVAASAADRLTILLAQGGSFLRRDFVTGLTPSALACADFDRDGHQDIAVAHADGDDVWIWRGDGRGEFEVGSAGRISTDRRPGALRAFDVDGDGAFDLITANAGSQTVSILVNDGGGAFSTNDASRAGLGGEPTAIATGDLDGDGTVDLVAVRTDLRLQELTNRPARAARVRGLVMQLGTLSNGVFLPSTLSWDTLPGATGWILGVTGPEFGRYFENDFDSSIDVQGDASYYLYGDSGLGSRHAVQVRVDRAAGVSESAVFALACPDRTTRTRYVRVAGDPRIELGRPAVATVDRVTASAFTLNGVEDHVFELQVHAAAPPQPTAGGDAIVALTIQAGTTLPAGPLQFIDAARSWDTTSGRSGNQGWSLGVGPTDVAATLLNCADGSIALAAELVHFVYGDANLATGPLVRVQVEWSSGRRDEADFLVACPGVADLPSFDRLNGSARIELGRAAAIGVDRVGNNSLAPDGNPDHVWQLRVRSADPTPEPSADSLVRLAVEAGSFQFGSFAAAGRTWDTVPGRSGNLGWVLGLTANSPGAPFENCGDGSITLRAGSWFAYLDSELALGTALQVRADWSSGITQRAVFAVGDPSQPAAWNRLEGSSEIAIVSPGVTDQNRVSRDTLALGNGLDHVLELSFSRGPLAALASGCGADSLPQPRLDLLRAPRPGGALEVLLSRLPTLGSCVLLLGDDHVADLGALGAPGCTLFVAPFAHVTLHASAIGAVSWSLPLPADPALVGLRICVQAAVPDPRANALGLSLSNPLLGSISD